MRQNTVMRKAANSLSDDLIGVSFATALRVIGISDSRLRSWTKLGLVEPTIYRAGSWEFSLDDLVRARVVAELEVRGIHILRIVSLVTDYKTERVVDPLLKLRWAVDGHNVYCQHADGSWTGGRAVNQTVMHEVINPDEIRVSTRKDILRPAERSGRLEKRRGVMNGKDVFVGTRIPVEAVFSFLRHNKSTKQILAAYPDLTEKDITLARKLFAA
jgi:uncharacterized protein (DUF433 family)